MGSLGRSRQCEAMALEDRQLEVGLESIGSLRSPRAQSAGDASPPISISYEGAISDLAKQPNH